MTPNPARAGSALRNSSSIYFQYNTFDWLQQQINDLFDFPRFPEMQGLFDRRISPAVDLVEHPDRFTVECDLPVSIASGALTIKGEKKGERVNKVDATWRPRKPSARS